MPFNKARRDVADLVDGARELNRAPGTGSPDVTDDVRHPLATEHERVERSQVPDIFRKETDVERNTTIAALLAVFEREGRREPVPEGVGVGEQSDVRSVREPQRAHVGRRQVGVVEERRHATGGETTELHEGLSDVRRREEAALRAESRSRITGDLEADERAQETVRSGRAVIELDTAADTPVDGVVRAAERLAIDVVGTDTTTDLQAAFGARDVEEASAVRGADADVFDRQQPSLREDPRPVPQQSPQDLRLIRGEGS